tara:strand:- start:4912 stop:5664 length:753 start_codon:yes stop_codon:yes gene_type:complete
LKAPYSPVTSSLTLVGVGPGDPSLLTLAAVKAIQDSTVVSFPITKEGEESLAAQIAGDWITEDKKRLPLIFPMVSEASPRKEAWKKAGHQLAIAVSTGEKVVFLCQGDVSLFSTSAYLLLELKANHPDCPLKLIPGVNSFSAAAAKGHWPLTLQQDQLLVMPAPENLETLERVLEDAALKGRVVVLLKVGKRWGWIRTLLERKNILDSSLFAQRVGFSDERVISCNDVLEEEAHYFSLVLIRQEWPKVIP